jgi:hypothetical protein
MNVADMTTAAIDIPRMRARNPIRKPNPSPTVHSSIALAAGAWANS